MANPFVHVELHTTDPAKAKDFYGKLFAWKMEDMEMGPGMTYTMLKPGEGTGGLAFATGCRRPARLDQGRAGRQHVRRRDETAIDATRGGYDSRLVTASAIPCSRP